MRWKKKMNYQVVNDAGLFHVVEVETEQVIKDFVFLNEARAFAKKLNNGLGFDGWTPNFFLKKVEKK